MNEIRVFVSLSILLSLFAFISGCGKKSGDETFVELKGGIKGGGVYVSNEQENIRSLDPVGINDNVSHHVAHQMYDLLIDLDTNLQLRPALATRWEISPDGLTYTFHLRKGVLFHDNACFPGGKGREFKAQDVKYSFNRILDTRTGSVGFDFYRNYVEGAKEVSQEITKAVTEQREPKFTEASGFKVLDDSTFQIKITKPFAPVYLLYVPWFCIYRTRRSSR
jgi:oligopeptide transport system substrate-binding protein